VARTLLGEREQALVLLRAYVRATPQMSAYLGADPVFRVLRDDPRFKALVASP